MDHVQESVASSDAPQQDFSHVVLPMLAASDAERTAHEAMLAVIDKASNGKTLWKSMADADDADEA